MALCSVVLLPALAQPPAKAGSGRAEMTPTERAQRDADKVFQWIRIQADKSVPRAPGAARAAASTTPTTLTAATQQPATTQSMAAVPAVESEADTIDPSTPFEATLIAAARIVPQTLDPFPPAPVVAAPELEPEAQLMLPLKLLSRVDPEMPRQLQPHIRSGQVQVRFTVQPDGRVAGPEVVQTTNRRLSEAAVDAVLQWRFAPITEARTATVEIGFKRD